MYGLAVNLIMSVSGHPSIINEISGNALERVQLVHEPADVWDWKMCLIKMELSKITYSFQILFKLELKLLLVCFFLPFSLWKIPSSPSLEFRTEILQKILKAF